MSRARSRTADSTDVKKSKSGLPRRLNEKIALIKEKEQAQSKQFEQAMMSIFEMQQARLHGGGGSMPSLQAIDTTPSYPPPPPYMTNMVTSTYHTPPTPMSPNTSNQQSAGSPAGRHMSLGRAQSCDSPGDCPATSRPQHYSQLWNVTGEWDNDLSRHKSDSDLQQSILMEQQHICRMNGQQQMFAPPNTHLSPQHYSSSGSQQQHLLVHQQNGNPLQLDMGFQEPNPANKRPTSMTAALLSPEQFPTNDSPTFGSLSSQTAASSLPDLTNMEFSCGLDVPLERDDDSPTIPKYSFFQHPGPSKLTTSIQANGVPFQQQQQYSANPPPASSGAYRHQQNPVFFGSHQQASNAHFSPPHSLHQQHKSRSFAPVSSSSLSPLSLETSVSGSSALFYTSNNPSYSTVQSQQQKMPEVPNPSFILSPPPIHQDTQPIFPQASTHTTPIRGSGYQQPQLFSSFDDSILFASSQLPMRQQQNPQHGSHFDSLQHHQQRLALQQRLASISMVNTPIRSHSEENLVKIQREILSNDTNMGQNPFMGNLANASSVPCVYVEPSNVEPCIDQDDSPTTGTGSPSTSASHASSPPLSRPSWIDQPHSMQEFVFHEWPVDSQGQYLGEKVKLGSPLSHHKSLTELNKLASEVMMDLSSNYQNKNHQLSLPSIVMSDLTVDEQQAQGGFLPQDLAMEDEVMQTFLADGSFAPFMLSGENSLPEPVDLFHDRLNF